MRLRLTLWLVGVVATLGILGGCASVFAAPRAVRQSFTSTTMGCVVTITVDDDDPVRARNAARMAQLELDRLDGVLSDWKANSELTALNSSSSLRVRASPDLCAVLRRALEISRATNGRFDPTIAPFVALWRTTRESDVLPSNDALAAAKTRVGAAHWTVDGSEVVRARNDLQLDFGGIGKGYGAICALRVLRDAGCPRALVAIAGDLAVGEAPRGELGWSVAIAAEANDESSEQLIACNQAISTSGASQQFVEVDGVRYAHIVDPRTGLGATAIAQVTVVGPLDCAVDALATALTLCNSDAEAAAILRASFPGFRARIERNEKAHWLP